MLPAPPAVHAPAIAYAIGIILALLISSLARLGRFDRDRVFYPTLTVAISSYYILFAVLGGSTRALILESLVLAGFVAVAYLGFRFNLWLVVVALAGHGLQDMVHPHLVANPGVPAWWPPFCMAYDIVAAGFLAWLLQSGALRSRPASPRDRAAP